MKNYSPYPKNNNNAVNHSLGYVTEMPSAFNEYVQDNEERIMSALSRGTAPYWVRDNAEYVSVAMSGEDVPASSAAVVKGASKASSTTITPAKNGGGGNTTPPTEPPTATATANSDDIQREIERRQDYIRDVMNGNAVPEHDVSTVEDIENKEKKYFATIPNDIRKHGISGTVASQFNFRELYDDFEKAISKQGMKFELAECGIALKDIGTQFNMELRSNGVICERTFLNTKNGYLYVQHNVLDIDGKYQGKGLSKEIIKAFYKQYDKIGVRYISVEADMNVGGYTWARYGFCTQNKTAALGALSREAPAELKERAMKIIDDYYTKNKLNPNTPFPMNVLTEELDKKEAQTLLLGTDWAGSIDLRDEKQRKVFENYMGWKR